MLPHATERTATPTSILQEVGTHPSSRRGLVLMLSPGRPIHLLALGALVLAAAGLLVGVLDAVSDADPPRIVDRFGLNGESTVPAWYAGALLLLCALVLHTVAGNARRSGHRYPAHWQVLSLAFAYLSLDEVASLHELANEPVRAALHLDGVLYLSWIVVAVPLVSAFALAYVPFLAHLPGRTRWLFVGAGTVFLAGSVGLELPAAALFEEGATDTVAYAVMSSCEELLEMLGVITFLYATVSYAHDLWPGGLAPATD